MIVRSFWAVFLWFCWVFQGKCAQGSPGFRGGSLFSSIRDTLFDRRKRHQRSFGFNVRKVYGKLAVHSNHGDVVHLSAGESGLLVQKLKGKAADQLLADRYAEDVDGIFGFYELPTGYFAAVIKDSEPLEVKSLPDIRKVKKITLIKVPSSPAVAYQHLNATELELEQARAEALLLRTFKQHSFYFSTGSYDISNTLQNNALGMQNGTVEANENFFWNLNAIAPLLHENCTAFVMPVVNAWIGSTSINYEGSDYELTLISRRSRRRQGPRYIKRGSDELGDVANFVETEQIVQGADGKATASFVQIRGSIPLFWTQPADWKLRPPVLTVPSTQLSQHSQALKSHLADMVNTYFTPLWGRVWSNSPSKEDIARRDSSTTDAEDGHELHPHHTIHMINLIDKKGVQAKLGKLWNSALHLMHSQPVSVFPRFGTYSPHKDPVAAYKIGSDGATAKVAATTTSEVQTILDGTTDRNATSVLSGAFNVTAQDLLRLHSVRYPHSSLDTPLLVDYADPGYSIGDNSVSVCTELIWFDYHHKCHDGPGAVLELFPLLQRAMHTDNLYVHVNGTTKPTVSLHHASSRSVGSQGGDQNMHILSTQKHIIRTNCMDCLDRTNVMQSVVSRWVLMRQIVSLRDAILPEVGVDGGVGRNNSTSARARLLRVNHYKSLELPDKKMESEFRRLWTHNGDHLSVMYAGSRAMKRDVTQNGVRTQRGAVDDAMSAAQRFFVNNLRDEHKQLGIDLLLGLANYETLTLSFTSAGTGVAGAGVGSGGAGVKSDGDSGIISGGSVRLASSEHRPKLRQFAPQRLLDSHKKRVREFGVFSPAAPVDQDDVEHPPPAAVLVAPHVSGAVHREQKVQEKLSDLHSKRAFPRANAKHKSAQSSDETLTALSSDTSVSQTSRAQEAQGGELAQARAPMDPDLARFESKLEIVLSDLLQEIAAVRSSKFPTAGKTKGKMITNIKNRDIGVIKVMPQGNKGKSERAIQQQSAEKFNARHNAIEKAQSKTQHRKHNSYLLRLRNVLLAPIIFPLKCLFGW